MTLRQQSGTGKPAGEGTSAAPSNLDPQAVVCRAEELVAQQRARAKLALDFAGWYSHGEARVWTLGYYEDGAFYTVASLSKSALTAQWFPRLHRRWITPYVTRPGMPNWVQALPNAY